MSAFLEVPEVIEELTAILNKNNIQVDALGWWTTIVEKSVETSRNIITSKLMKRGYSLAQILDWSRLHEYHRDIALYWSFIKGNVAERFNTVQIDRLNREWELDDVPIIDEPVTSLGGLTFVMLTDSMKERLSQFIHTAKWGR